MRFRRIIALFCASTYITAFTTATAVELPAVPSVAATAEQAGTVDTDTADINTTTDTTDITLTNTETEVTDTENKPTETTEEKQTVEEDLSQIKPSPHKMQVDGTPVTPQAYFLAGYNYYKLRDIAFLLRGTGSAFNVTWDNETKAVNLFDKQEYVVVGGELTSSSVEIRYVLPSTATVLLNGKKIKLTGYCINANNYYRIADIAAAVGFPVSYDNDTQTVHITTEPASSEAPEEPGKSDTPGGSTDHPGNSTDNPGNSTDNPDNSTDNPGNATDHPGGSTDEPNGTTNQPDEPPAANSALSIYEVQVETSLSIRSGPGFGYSVIGLLPNGTRLVVDALEDGWARLRETSSEEGSRYCSVDYLVRLGDYGDPTILQTKPSTTTTPSDPATTDPAVPRTSHIDSKMTVIIDPGHGGSDLGAQHPTQNLDEKHINLYVARYLRDYLQQAGATVIMVRDDLETGEDLSLRGSVMEQYKDSVDLFFSVHHNASTNRTAMGAQVLAQVADEGGGPTMILADALNNAYASQGLAVRNIWFRHGEHGDYYYVNRKAASLQIPAVISEYCFIDNDEDLKFIDSDEDWQSEAHALCTAILDYFKQVDF